MELLELELDELLELEFEELFELEFEELLELELEELLLLEFEELLELELEELLLLEFDELFDRERQRCRACTSSSKASPSPASTATLSTSAAWLCGAAEGAATAAPAVNPKAATEAVISPIFTRMEVSTGGSAFVDLTKTECQRALQQRYSRLTVFSEGEWRRG